MLVCLTIIYAFEAISVYCLHTRDVAPDTQGMRDHLHFP